MAGKLRLVRDSRRAETDSIPFPREAKPKMPRSESSPQRSESGEEALAALERMAYSFERLRAEMEAINDNDSPWPPSAA